MPRLSIITINYNNCRGLHETIVSVTSQKYSDFEFLIIDGGSTDGSVDLINQISNELAFWVSEKDNGIYNAMNKGIKAATGDYLLFLNSGDYLLAENSLGEFKLEENHSDIIAGDILLDDSFRSVICPPDELTFSYFIKRTLPHQSTLIKKSLFDKFGLYNEEFKIVADWAFFLQMICVYNVSYHHVNAIISVYNIKGFSSNIENGQLFNEEKRRHLNKCYPVFLRDYEKSESVNLQLKLITHSLSFRFVERLKKLLRVNLIKSYIKKLRR